MDHDDVISLQDYLTVLHRQRWIVVATVVVVVVAALGMSLAQAPIYEATTEVVVEPVRRTQDVTLEQLLAPPGDTVQTERLIVTSRPVTERVVEQLGLSEAPTTNEDVRVEAVADTRVIRIVAANTDPAAAVAMADAFADAYLDYKRDDALEGLLAARGNLDARAADLRASIDELDEDDAAEGAERDALLAQLAQVSAQIAELGASSASVTGGGSVLAPAELPEGPVSPQPLRTGALAVVFGLLLGVGLAFLRDHFDDVVRDETDFRRSTAGKPILGRIPSWSDPEGGDRLATVLEPASLASEAYRELSSGVRFLLAALDESYQAAAVSPRDRLGHAAGDSVETIPGAAAADGAGAAAGDGGPATPTGVERHGRSIVLCSAAAGDGKTSTAANLAVAAARTGLTTLLVDADLRRSTVGKRFGLGRTGGLSDLLAGNGTLADHVVPVGVEGLYVLPAGTIPPNPHELLASTAMRAFEQRVRSNVDLVIYDTPAVLAVPDALELGRHADVAILVGRAEVSSRRQLTAAMERLHQVGTDIAGTVLNDLSGRADGYYYAYYYAEGNGGVDPEKTANSDRGGPRANARKQRKANKRGPQKGGANSQGRVSGAPLEWPESATTNQRRRSAVRTFAASDDAPSVDDLFGKRG